MPGIKRDPRLTGLSSDHHHALVLAMRAQRSAAANSAENPESVWEAVAKAFPRELDPHFEVEERILLPALRRAGEVDLAERTLREHESLRSILSDRSLDVRARLAAFGSLLEAHVRFEERELFERAQRILDPTTLDAIGTARPKIST